MLQTGDDAVREWRDHRLRVMGEYSPGGGERERKALSGFWATSGTLLSKGNRSFPAIMCYERKDSME